MSINSHVHSTKHPHQTPTPNTHTTTTNHPPTRTYTYVPTNRFRDKLASFDQQSIPQEARGVIDDELSKLSNLEASSAEFNVTRNYLDWLLSIPWGRFNEENADIAQATTVCVVVVVGMWWEVV